MFISILALLGTGCGGKNQDTGGSIGPEGTTWTEYSHPCIGNRTDAMWFDDANTGFVGCGSTTIGYGLYTTTDGGNTWSTVPSVNNILDSMRVGSIQRASNGNLYIGGTGDNNLRIVYIDGSGTLKEYYSKPETGAQSWQTYQVGTFRLDSNNRAVSESLTGSDVMYWPNAGSQAVNGYGWWNNTNIEGSGAQILDMEIHDDKFYAVGSTINQPPYFFYEDNMTTEFTMQAIKLSGEGIADFEGEVWDIAIDNSGSMLLAGLNQGTGVGTLWYSTGDVTNKDNWVLYDISSITPDIPSNATRFYGACRYGNLMVAVGDFSQKSEGILVYSKDSGESWTFAESGTGPLSRCQIVDGEVFITGADGLFAKFNP